MKILDKQTFSLVGVTKCGTSSLYAYLAQHPEICLSEPKEPWCFEDPASYRFFQGNHFAEYYRRYFPSYQGQPAVGDCNARKLTFPWSLRYLNEQFPDLRVIVLVRDPVERAFSEWWMDYFAGSEPLGFEDAIQENLRLIDSGRVFHEDEKTALEILPTWWDSRRSRLPMPTRTYLGSGYYWKGVQRAQELFGKERVKVVPLERLHRDPQVVMKQIFEFIEVSSDVTIDSARKHNPARGEMTRSMVSFARKTGLPKIVPQRYKDLLLEGVGDFWHKMGDTRPLLTPATRAELVMHFRDHNQKLAELTGLDLSAWDAGAREKNLTKEKQGDDPGYAPATAD